MSPHFRDLLNGVPIILSEDFKDGRVIDGVGFIDPFVRDLDAEALLV